MNTLSRSDIRKQVRQARRALTPAEHLHATQRICKNLSNTHLFRNCQRVAGFIANDGEPSLNPLMEQAWKMGKQWHLPIIGMPNINQLWFAPYNKGDQLELNRFAIPEPSVHLHQTPKPWGLDLILMPLVAFDSSGNRLGMGKGYYDRTLQFLQQRKRWRKPKLVGIAYELQKFDQLPFQPWDVPLDAIATEKTVYNISNIRL